MNYNHPSLELIRNAIALLCAACICLLPVFFLNKEEIRAPAALSTGAAAENEEYGLLAKTGLWQYLRAGLNYLEASGKDVPTYYKHPGGVAYGPLAMTKAAIQDVKQHYPRLARHRFEDIIRNRDVYEEFAFLYADLLLKYYLNMDYTNMPKEEVFEVLEKAWFLGPSLYARGHPVLFSREVKAREYLNTGFIESSY